VIDSAFDGEPQQQRQDQGPNHTEEPSNQKPSSSDDAGFFSPSLLSSSFFSGSGSG
jgi:hypothetical protein